MKEIFVTNYKRQIRSKPIKELYPHARIKAEGDNEISINESLFIHVFDEIPFMRNMPVNKSWFENNIYHYKDKNKQS